MTWGVPDWTDATAYPEPDGLTLREWWWQFTRRRPDYRDLWTRWAPTPDATSATTDDPDGLRRTLGLSWLLDPRMDFGDRNLMLDRYPVNAGHVRRRDEAELVRYGAFLAGLGGDMLDREVDWRRARAEADDAAGLYSFQFDLTAPLEPQLERARKHMREVQAARFGDLNTRKLRHEKWPLYLRALDARDAGAAYITMATVFWPDETGALEYRARDTHRAAVALRNKFPI